MAMASASQMRAANVLLVIDGASMNSSETARKTQFETWGHTVTTIQDSSSQTSFDAAMAAVDVVYIPMTVADWEIANKAKSTTKGVVCEERYIDDDMGFSTGTGWNSGLTQTEILNNSHSVTTGLSTGFVTIVSSSQELAMMNATVASGMTVLSKQNYTDGNMLGVIDTGGALAGGGTAAGRRVRMPWGGDGFTWSALNSNGLLIAQQAITWAVGVVNPLQLNLKLNEASGTTASDSSTYNRPGTVTGTASWVTGRRQNAFDFNGSTKIEVNSLLGSPTSFSLACWARIDVSDTSGAEGISVGDYLVLRLHDTSGGGPTGRFYYGSGSYRSVSYSTSFVARGWHHFAVTFDDATDNLKLYIDGVNVATTSTTSSISWSGLGTTTRLGAHGNTSTAYDLDGAVDDARVYSKALTQSEIADLYGLVGRWNLTETSGTAAADSSGKALNGTYTSGPTVGQAGPYPGPGQYSASFDGTNDYVNGAASTNYSFDDGFSIAAWVNLDTYVNNAALMQVGSTTEACGLAISGTGQVTVSGRSSGGVQTLTTTATLPTSKWKHVVGTYDGATLKVYIDGQLALSAASVFTVTAAAGNLTIAASLEGADEFLDGRVQGARLYNRAIAADEVADLYGLVGHWKLNEGSSTTLADSSGVGGNAAFNGGAPTWVSGVYSNALNFNGTTDDAITSGSFAPPPAGTVAYWFRSSGPPASQQRHFGLGGDWESWQNPDGIVRFDLCGDGEVGGFKTASTPMKSGSWYHFVAMYDTADESYSIYINGVLDKSGTSSVNLANQSAAQLSFGTRTGTTQRLAGSLDDFRVYNRKISATEIAELYGLMGHWKFSEGGGTVAADSSGFSNNATLSGAAWTNNGVGNAALDCNGTGGIAATSSAFAPPAAGTVAFWMRGAGPIVAQGRVFGLGGDWEARQQPDGTIKFDLGASPFVGNEPFSTLSVSALGQWKHVAVTFDAADDSYKVYVNGELQASGTSPVDLIPQSAAILSFGTRTGNSEYWKGALRDFRIYDRKLSQAQIYELYGLMAWYKLDESSGTTAADATGLGMNGVYSGAPTLGVASNGNVTLGTAVEFFGANNVQIAGLYDKTSSVSAAAWARLDSSDTSGAEIISLGDHFLLRLQNGSVQAYYYNGGTSVGVTATRVVAQTGWHHFAAVLNESGTLKVYVDGNEAASTPLSGAISYSGLGSNTRIASHGNGDTAFDFSGRIDDVRVFGRAITPDEVFQIYHGSRISGIKILQWVEAR